MVVKANGETAAKKGSQGSTRKERKAGAEAGRKQKAVYRQLKTFALEHEKDNDSKLFVIHEKGNWWKMVGHSAIMFHYEIAKQIGMTSRLLPDSDYDCRSEEGIVNIRDISMLDQKLAAAKIFSLDVEKEYRVYNIGKKYTQADIEAFIKSKDLEWAKINSIILPKEIIPDLATNLRLLLAKIYYSTRTLDPCIREVSSKIMLQKVSDLICEYSRLANSGNFAETDFLERVGQEMVEITARMAIIADLRLLPTKTIYQILQAIAKVKRVLMQCRPKKV